MMKMIGILITGHGNFASGILSSLKMIVSEPEHVIGVDFTEEDSTDILKKRMLEMIPRLGTEILILTDLQGGTPYNTSVILKTELKEFRIEVLAGCNLPMLITAVFGRNHLSLAELAKQVTDSGKDNIKQFIYQSADHNKEIEPDEGI